MEAPDPWKKHRGGAQASDETEAQRDTTRVAALALWVAGLACAHHRPLSFQV